MSYLFCVLFLFVSSSHSVQEGVEEGNFSLIEVGHPHGIPPHVHYPPPVIVNPQPSYDPYCGFGQGSSVCYTYGGNTCAFHFLRYQPSWFSACVSLGYGIFTGCVNTPQWPSLVFQRSCALKNTPCVCSFTRLHYGYGYITVYEQGLIF